jgi:RNA polymerase sigma-70 factor, ECF subfamily
MRRHLGAGAVRTWAEMNRSNAIAAACTGASSMQNLGVREDADLRAAFARGRKAWPGLKLDQTSYALRLASTEIADGDLAQRAEDIYLAIACACGNAAAHRMFEEHFLSQIPAYVSRFRFAPHLLDEVQQRVRIRQLLGARPGLSRYRGRGPLGAWVRTTAVRVAFDVATQREEMMSDAPDELQDVWAAFGDGPEATTIKNFYRPRLTGALEESLAALGAREKTLLRLHVIDHRTTAPIGRTFGVHRATAARWLAAIRRRVFDDLRARAALNWGASASDLRDLVAILRDEIDLNLTQALGEANPGCPE